MKRTSTQFARLIELDRRIRERAYPNCLTFSAEWEVSQKTVQRDIDFLRDSLGAPLAYDRVRKGFFYSEENWFLPAFALSEGELLALLMSLRMFQAWQGSPMEQHLRTILDKLEALLPDSVSVRPDLLFSQFSFKAPPAKPVAEEVWLPVIRGLTGKCILRIRYRAFEEEKAKEWDFNPCHLANLQGEWYVFGFAAGHDDVLQLSMPRIQKAALTDRVFTVPASFNAQKLIDGAFGRAVSGGDEFEVELAFSKAVATWVTERQWHPGQKVRVLRDGKVELRFKARGMVEVLRWVMAWGGDVMVLDPQELADAVKAEARRMLKPGRFR